MGLRVTPAGNARQTATIAASKVTKIEQISVGLGSNQFADTNQDRDPRP